MNTLEVQNTQNKIYNEIRRTYLDDSDLKEGEVICRKCKGTGISYSHPFTHVCSKCSGEGIVDWVTQAVERPVVFVTDSSAACSISSGQMTSFPVYPSPFKVKSSRGLMINIRKSLIKMVTNYKRRKLFDYRIFFKFMFFIST